MKAAGPKRYSGPVKIVTESVSALSDVYQADADHADISMEVF
jgi:hypothetical protein